MQGRSWLFVLLSFNVCLLALFLVGWIGPSTITGFNPDIDNPIVPSTSFVHPMASVALL